MHVLLLLLLLSHTHRFPPATKAAILVTLGQLIRRAGTGLKPFVPQLQTTFVKCLNDQVGVKGDGRRCCLCPWWWGWGVGAALGAWFYGEEGCKWNSTEFGTPAVK